MTAEREGARRLNNKQLLKFWQERGYTPAVALVLSSDPKRRLHAGRPVRGVLVSLCQNDRRKVKPVGPESLPLHVCDACIRTYIKLLIHRKVMDSL